MSDERLLRTTIEFVVKNAKLTETQVNTVLDKIEDLEKKAPGAGAAVSNALNKITPAADKAATSIKAATSAVKGWNESLQSRWTTQFKKEMGELPSQIKATERAIRSLNSAMLGQTQDRGNASRSAMAYIPANTPDTRKVGSSFGAPATFGYQSDAHVQTYRKMQQEKQALSQQTAIYNQYLYDEAKAANKAASATDKLAEPSLPRLRYALYDVASTLGFASAALAGFATASVAAAVKFESSFTNVDRTIEATGFQLGFIRDQLLVLSREIPLSFQDITQIASLGGQLGVAKSDLAGFTETVAQFSAVTNVSIDEAAKSFGSLGELLNVPTSEFQNLGSAIALVGINSVATESEILSVANQIGGVAAAAGLSADYVVGLSSALASLRLPPEQSRGALTKVFQQVNRAAADGGVAIQQFATVLGVSTAEATRLAQTDMEGFFNKFITGLSGLDAGQLTTTLDALGLSELRVTNTLTRLAGNLDLVNKSLDLSSEGYDSGAVLAALYAKRVDDIASKFQILINGLQELAATAGTALLPIIGPLLDGFTDFVNVLSDILTTDTGKIFAGIAVGGAALLAVLFAVVGAAALTVASMAAMKTAMIELGIVSKTATTGLAGFASGMFGVSTATGGAAAALKIFKFALATTGIGLAVVALGTLAAAFLEVGDNSTMAFNRAVSSTAGLSDAVKADTLAYQEAVASGNTKVAQTFTEFTVAGQEGANKWDENTQRIANSAEVLGTKIPNAFFDATGAIDDNTYALGENTRAWFRNQLLQSETFQQLTGDQAFLDTWRKLGADFDTVLEISATQGRDGINEYFIGLAEAAYAGGEISAGALNTIRLSLEGELGLFGLLGGRDQFGQLANLLAGAGGALQLVGFGFDDAGTAASDASDGVDDFSGSVGGAAARVYTLVDYANDLLGVFKRASDIRFKSELSADELADSWDNLSDRIREARMEIDGLVAGRNVKEYFLSVANAYGDELRAGELRAEIADINENIADTQADASTELQGNSKAARQNRSVLSGLINNYEDYIAALAESGADQSTLNAAVARSKQEFLAQATALGFSNAQLQPYIASFGDMATVINQVPRNITVTANTNPALQALNEFVAQARSAGGAAGSAFTEAYSESLKKQARGAAILASIQAALAIASNPAEPAGRRVTYSDRANALSVLYNSGQYADGGYTGRGGKYEPAGVVHKGEYVVPKSQVNQSTGLPYANALGGQLPASRGASYAGGGFVGGAGGMMVSLSPQDRALLRGVGATGDVIVAVDSREIARASASGSKKIISEGGSL